MEDDPCTGFFFSPSRLAPSPCCRRRHPPTGTPRSPRMWCPRWTSVSSCMTARGSCIIGIRRAGTSDRSRGHPSSSSTRHGPAGTRRGKTARGTSGPAIMIIATGPATVTIGATGSPTTIIAAASSTPVPRAGCMDRRAIRVGTTGSSIAATAPVPTTDVSYALRPAGHPSRPALSPVLGSQMQQRPRDSAGDRGRADLVPRAHPPSRDRVLEQSRRSLHVS
jgi:hypothetical protein